MNKNGVIAVVVVVASIVLVGLWAMRSGESGSGGSGLLCAAGRADGSADERVWEQGARWNGPPALAASR